MAILGNTASVKKVKAIFSALVLIFFTTSGIAQTVDTVTTIQDENGWKLKVNGEDFYVKGVVWGYSPRGQNYSYNLWGQPGDFIKKVIDQEFSLLKAANVNAIRAFSDIPPKWITYIYQQYEIMTVINPLFGRYGALIGGEWRANTNYQDEFTRQTLKFEFLDIVEKYKDTPGVLMFALGNESNYGLSWSSFEIENLPEGEQHEGKARFLYSLFAETIDEAKEIDSNHPFTIVNGDIQYLDLIAEYGKNWDLLGVNSYRGISFESDAGASLWADVKEKLDLPIVFMEFGSDAFNARDFVEDQESQAHYLKGQWQEMYKKSYGNGEQGNSIGGFVFEWRDEWWKYKQTENLDVHDRTASWENGGYRFDHVEGQNNMNEEWFGITRLGNIDGQGIYVSEPRMAYYVLRDIWSVDPYATSVADINSSIQNIDMDFYAMKSDIDLLKTAQKESTAFAMTGGSIQAEFAVKGRENEITEEGEDGLIFTDGQMAFLDFAFQPSNRIKGNFSLNVLANVIDSDFEYRYGDRGKPITVQVREDDVIGPAGVSDDEFTSNERIEIYDFNATYEGDNFDLESFYHVPRYHWPDKGDFFGLLRETTDMEGQDIWNSKAPYGVEFTGKGKTEGLTVLMGPEVYWGANPKAMFKYDFSLAGMGYTFIHSEDVANREGSSSATEATTKQSRQTALYTRIDISWVTMELGGLIASGEKVGDSYDRLEGDDVVVNEIKQEDTLGFKAKFGFDVMSAPAYLGLNYAGLVADSGDQMRENGTELPYSGLGNKKEVEGGILLSASNFTIYPRFLIRKNLLDANPLIVPSTTGTLLFPGISPRNYDDDPFAVLDNREAKAAEIIWTYDTTPASYFYHWNADITEDAPFAMNFGVTYTRYDTATDSDRFYYEEGDTNVAFGEGLIAEDVYLVKSKMFFNPGNSVKYILNLAVGKQQSTGKPGEETVEFFGIDGKVVVNRKHIFSGYFKQDAFGPYDFYRQFNLTYPQQIKLEYAQLLDQKMDEKSSSKLGVKVFYRTLDEHSPEDEYEDGENDHMFEIQTYFKYSF